MAKIKQVESTPEPADDVVELTEWTIDFLQQIQVKLDSVSAADGSAGALIMRLPGQFAQIDRSVLNANGNERLSWLANVALPELLADMRSGQDVANPDLFERKLTGAQDSIQIILDNLDPTGQDTYQVLYRIESIIFGMIASIDTLLEQYSVTTLNSGILQGYLKWLHGDITEIIKDATSIGMEREEAFQVINDAGIVLEELSAELIDRNKYDSVFAAIPSLRDILAECEDIVIALMGDYQGEVTDDAEALESGEEIV